MSDRGSPLVSDPGPTSGTPQGVRPQPGHGVDGAQRAQHTAKASVRLASRYLHGRGGHYLLTVKANQPTLLRRLRALPWSQIEVANRQQARGHGRVETRAITVVSLTRCPDLGGEFFPHAAQAIKLVRRGRRLSSRKWTTVTVYAITSLTAFQADPALLARRIRGHWAINKTIRPTPKPIDRLERSGH